VHHQDNRVLNQVCNHQDNHPQHPLRSLVDSLLAVPHISLPAALPAPPPVLGGHSSPPQTPVPPLQVRLPPNSPPAPQLLAPRPHSPVAGPRVCLP
jgi:hypothetical protein